MKQLSILTCLVTIICFYSYGQVPETGGTFTGLVNFNEGVNPNFNPTNYNNQTLLNSSSFNNGFSYHNISGAAGYPNGTGSVWTFKQSDSRLHRIHFSKNSNKFHITSWNNSNSSWNAWEQIITNINYKSILGFNLVNGMVGIGSPNPDEKLFVNGTASILGNIGVPSESHWKVGSHTLELNNSDAGDVVLSFHRSGHSNASIRHSSELGLIFTGNGSNTANHLHILKEGNIGIGTAAPENKLEVYKDSGNEIVAQFRTQEGRINIAAAGNSTGNSSYGNYISSRNSDNSAYKDIGFKTAPGISQLLVKTNGSVGIGTSNTGTHKLSVNGSIRSKEVKVEANWSDFVFYDNYDLRTLEEVEEHINKNGHLPEIPSEAEVTENGINLGEMNAKLLQKIEELTLYLIEQNKEIKELKKLTEQQQSDIKELQSK